MINKPRVRVLLVEDNAGDARLVREMLAESEITHFELVHVDLLGKGLEYLAQENVDVVLLDLSLANTHGLVAISRTLSSTPHVPVVVLTGLNDEEAATKAVREGAQDYLIKGQVDSPLLVRAIRYAIERKRTQQELRESEEKYRALFEESKDAIYISIPDGRFIDINPAGVELLGYSSKEELLQIDITRDLYLDPADRESYQQEIIRQGYVKDYELTLKRKDGQKLTVLSTTIAIRDEKGNVAVYRGIMHDMTHIKQLQQQLLQSQKIKAIGRLAGGVAHDFNNILMAIGSYAELIFAKAIPECPSRQEAFEIQKAVERGAQLTRQLLAFSRKQILSPKILDLNQSISNIENMFQRLIGEDVELVTVLAESLGRVKVDPGQIEQVLMNLAVNARDAMPAGGRLIIETCNVELEEEYARSHMGAVPGRYVKIAITDNGHGMDEATMSRIFEPFFTTKEPGKGTGLGLAMVYGIVKQSEGYIQVYSEPGHGTTFKIYFPRVDDLAELLAPPSSSASEPQGRGEIILLVDDNESLRSAVAALLEMKGYRVLEAPHGHKALEVSRHYTGSIDLLITDVIMPEMSGRELAEHLSRERPGLKVLFMSGYTDEAITRHGLLDANSAFLSKPATMQTLLLKIRELLGGGEEK